MHFNRGYFDSLDQMLMDYQNLWLTQQTGEQTTEEETGITATVHVATNLRYRIARILEVTDSVVSFLFYGEGVKAGDILPMVSVPYSVIVAVEVEPAAPKSKFGFQQRKTS